jgi:hypothetical protein
MLLPYVTTAGRAAMSSPVPEAIRNAAVLTGDQRIAAVRYRVGAAARFRALAGTRGQPIPAQRRTEAAGP